MSKELLIETESVVHIMDDGDGEWIPIAKFVESPAVAVEHAKENQLNWGAFKRHKVVTTTLIQPNLEEYYGGKGFPEDDSDRRDAFAILEESMESAMKDHLELTKGGSGDPDEAFDIAAGVGINAAEKQLTSVARAILNSILHADD